MCAAVNGMTPSCMRVFASGYTVTRIENGSDAKQSTIAALRGALEKAGVEFIAENGGGAGARLKPKKTKRKSL